MQRRAIWVTPRPELRHRPPEACRLDCACARSPHRERMTMQTNAGLMHRIEGALIGMSVYRRRHLSCRVSDPCEGLGASWRVLHLPDSSPELPLLPGDQLPGMARVEPTRGFEPEPTAYKAPPPR
jgi:hypothetical protein